jgi:hypothetical protein
MPVACRSDFLALWVLFEQAEPHTEKAFAGGPGLDYPPFPVLAWVTGIWVRAWSLPASQPTRSGLLTGRLWLRDMQAHAARSAALIPWMELGRR